MTTDWERISWQGTRDRLERERDGARALIREYVEAEFELGSTNIGVQRFIAANSALRAYIDRIDPPLKKIGGR